MAEIATSTMEQLIIERNPFSPQRWTTQQVAQNPIRGAFMGCGTCPVQVGPGPSAQGASRTFRGLHGLDGIRRSGSMLRAGHYQGSLGRHVNGPSQGRALRALSQRMVLADAGYRSGLGGLGGGLGTISACDVAKTASTIERGITSFLTGTTGSGGEAGAYLRTYGGAASGVVGSLCPAPTAPATPAGPPASVIVDRTGGGSDAMAQAMLQMMRDQQAAQTAKAAADAAAAASGAAAKDNTMLYAIGGGVALLAVVLLMKK